jgi:NAD(P)-dependent dehydrogenase (short-subunit alcohol dehydrogenase family)
MRRLDSKVILVAGAGSIGNELARRYAREGAAVVVGDIDEGVAQEVVEEIRGAGGEATATRLDGSDAESVQAAVALAVGAYGGLDGLHANFACFPESTTGTNVTDVPLELYDLTMNVNVRGHFLCTRFALPAILARGGGAILYTSSGAAMTGSAFRVAYGMSKAAGQSLMRHVATAFGPEGVRANSIAPGVIEKHTGPLRAEVLEIARAKARINSRLGQPADIAGMSALLMSDEGSYITGQVISIDGGITMRS